MGYYAQRHGNNNTPVVAASSQDIVPTQDAPKRSYYRERHLKEVPPSEDLMQRALTPRAQVAETVFNNPIMKNPIVSGLMSASPFGAARSLYNNASNAPLVGGLGGGLIGGTMGAPNVGMGLGTSAGEAAKQGVDWFKYGDKPTGKDLLKIPAEGLGAYAGGKALEGIGGVAKNVFQRAKPIAKNVSRMFSSKKALKYSNRLESVVEAEGSKLSGQFGKAMDDLQSTRPESRVSFSDVFKGERPEFDVKVSKLLSKTPEFQPEYLDNLTLKESQEVINSLKANLRQSLRTGDIVKSDERGIMSFLDKLRSRQLSAFPEHEAILGKYGEGIEAYKDVSGNIPSMLEGHGNRISRAAQEQSLKKISPGAHKSFRGYQKTKKGVQIGASAAGAGGTIAVIKKLLGG